MPPSDLAGIACPIDLFPVQEEAIARLTQAINQARSASLKAPYAQDLIAAIEALLACEAYDKDNLNCCLCHNFSHLRHKTASLVVKAGRLDEHRRSQL